MIKDFRVLFKSYFIKIFLILIILSFVLWGIGDILKYDYNNYAAKIGSHIVSIEEFSKSYSDEKFRLEQLTGKSFTEQEINQFNLKPYVLNKLVNTHLLLEYSKQLGISVSDASVANEIKNISIFKDENGKFDKKLFKKYLINTNTKEKDLIEKIRDDLTIRILVSSISSRPIKLPNSEHIINDYVNLEFDIDLIKIDLDKIHVTNPSREQVEEVYNQNQQLFMTSEKRDFDFVSFDKSVVNYNITVTEDEIKEKFDTREFKDNVKTYEEMKFEIKEEILRHKKEQAFAEFLNVVEDYIATNRTIEEIAKSQKLELKKLNNVSKEDKSLNIFGNNKSNIFNMEPHSDLQIFYNEDDRNYYLVVCKQIISPRLKTMNEVEQDIKNIFISKEKNKLIQQVLNSNKTEDEKIEEVKHKLNASIINRKIFIDNDKNDESLPAELIKNIIKTEMGSFTSSVDNGKVKTLARVKKVRESNSDGKHFDHIRNKIQNDTKSEIIDELIIFLRDQNKISVNQQLIQM